MRSREHEEEATREAARDSHNQDRDEETGGGGGPGGGTSPGTVADPQRRDGREDAATPAQASGSERVPSAAAPQGHDERSPREEGGHMAGRPNASGTMEESSAERERLRAQTMVDVLRSLALTYCDYHGQLVVWFGYQCKAMRYCIC